MGSNPLDGIGPYGKPHPEKNKGPNLPIVGVSWEDAQVFMEEVNSTLGSEDGGKMSLPTEAQYEFAARAGETGMYPEGSLDEVAWHDGNSGGYMKPVGTKKANAWGLHDMNGSAWEWVQDCYYEELPSGTDPIAEETGPDRVIRGGCWFKEATRCRLATRSYRWQGASQCFSIGVRIVRNSWPVAVSKPAIDPEINGQSVSKITYQGSSPEESFVQSFEQTGPKSWMSGEAVYNEVTLARDYYLGAFEVTQAQYSKLMGNNPSKFQGDMIDNVDSSNHPVDQVSWEDAVEFCKRLSELPEEKAAGRVYRLPTEAEWEYACRSGSNAPFGFGGLELADDYGWFSSNCKGISQPVGKKDPNAWGLYDMHGNVMEWCSDWAGDYPEGAVSDPTGPKEGDSRMIRGGSWLTPAMLCKSGCRSNGFPPDTRSDYVGFRVAMSPAN